MKIHSFAIHTIGAILASINTGVEGFSIVPITTPTSKFSSTVQPTTAVKAELFFAEESGGEDDAKEVVPSSKQTIYDRLGFQEDQIAIGIDENELLQWLGNREDIVNRFMDDNKGFDRERAEQEVDKFVMDSEMVNAFIAYEKKKADPKFLRQQAEDTLSDPATWGTYVFWILGGAGFAYVKNVIVEPKYASGEWEEIHITLPGAAPAATSAVSDVASEAINAAGDSTVSAVTDAITSGI